MACLRYVCVEHVIPIFNPFGSSSVCQISVTSSQMPSATKIPAALIISAGILYTPGDLPHFYSLITSVTSSWLGGFSSLCKCVPVDDVHCLDSLPPLLRMCFPSTQNFSGNTYYLLIYIPYQARFGRIAFLSEMCLLTSLPHGKLYSVKTS